MANFFDTIGGLFGEHKDAGTTTTTQTAGAQGGFDLGQLVNMGSDLLGSDAGKQILSSLGNIKSLNTEQIQGVLTAMGRSSDTQVQAARQDLQTVSHDGESFVAKLKAYIPQIAQLLPTILPALQGLLAKQ